MKNRKDEIRTPRQGAMVGTIGRVGNQPVAVVKQGNKVDTLSVDEFASDGGQECLTYQYFINTMEKPKSPSWITLLLRLWSKWIAPIPLFIAYSVSKDAALLWLCKKI